MNILVIGAGSWGTAIAMILARNSYNITLYTRNLQHAQEINSQHTNAKYLHNIKLLPNITATNDLAIVSKQDVIILVIPSDQIIGILPSLQAYNIQAQTVIGIASKGIDGINNQLLSTMLQHHLPVNRQFILAGPNLAHEVASGLPCAITIASLYADIRSNITRLFYSSKVTVTSTADIITTQIASAYKNVIAIITGIIIAKQYGYNCKAYILTYGLREIHEFAKQLGSTSPDLNNFAVIGDLMLTNYSLDSRNARFGYNLGKCECYSAFNKNSNLSLLEGVKATQSLYSLAQKLKLTVPIVECAYSILYYDTNIEAAIENMLQRINHLYTS